MVIRVALLLFCLVPDGPGAGSSPGDRRQHGFGLFGRLSSASVMRATTLSTSFVRPTVMWFRLWTRIFVRGVPQHMHRLLRDADRNSRCNNAGHSCAKIPATLMWSPGVSSTDLRTTDMCGPPSCAPQPITKCKPRVVRASSPHVVRASSHAVRLRACRLSLWADHDAGGATAHSVILHGTSCRE